MNFKTTINRAIIALDTYLSSHRKRHSKDLKSILIVFQQAFGDSIIIQNSLFQYMKLFPAEYGYRIKIIVQPVIKVFMQDNLQLPNGLKMETVDFKKYISDYKYFKFINKQYQNTASTLIIPGASLSGEIFSINNDANRKIGLINSIDVTKPFIMALFYKKAFTEKVRPEKTDMMLQRHRKMINYLATKQGINELFKAGLPKLISKQRIIENNYAVICPGASIVEKCWPIERFTAVADYLIETYHLPIHLCGGNGEEVFAEKMKEQSKHPNNLISHIGTTSFSDWSAIVQHADIVIGNDSATMHLAAAARVPSICIAGVYDKYQFFPYKVDELEPGDRLPVTILHDMPCEWCRTIGYNAGYGNEECKKRIEAGLCSICIDLITVDEVKAAIDNLMKESK